MIALTGSRGDSLGSVASCPGLRVKYWKLRSGAIEIEKRIRVEKYAIIWRQSPDFLKTCRKRTPTKGMGKGKGKGKVAGEKLV